VPPIDDQAELEVGTLVGEYRVERRLGKGATGTVYEAHEPSTGERVAVKVLRQALAERGSALERFRREGLAANRVHHPAIVEVLAVGALPDGRPYLVMPLLEGKTLREEIAAHQPLPQARAWAIAREAAVGLAAAHEVGIVHRDLKPDNIYLEQTPGRPERVRILDFGLAKFLVSEEPGKASLTETGGAVGTPAYMAPEQWFNAGVSAATDQYALGALLFEMLVGGPPFRAEQLNSVLQMHLHERPPALSARGATVPPAVEAVVSRALAKVAADRFDSMLDLIRAGDAAFGVAPPASPSTVPTLHPAAVGQRAGALRRFTLLQAGLLLLGAVGLLSVGYTGPGRHDPRHWTWIAGFAAYLHLGLFLLASVFLLLLARRSTRVATRTGWAWACCLAVALLILVEAVRLRRLHRRHALVRPSWRGWALVGLLAAAVGLDAGLYARMLARRDGYRLALAARFALLGRLDPPTGSRLSSERFRPSDAPALQITRDLVAVNSEPLARLAATELESRLRQRLTDVVAAEAARSGAPARADLLVTVDREVPYRTVSRVLRLAHEAGVRKLELLLARSPAPTLPVSAPPEAGHLIPSDFVALPAELAEQGFSADPEEPFARTAIRLIDLVGKGEASVRISVPRR
jgi:hypothetical protein